ncbi:HNH endonuclease signature motif containing protein [Rhizohabitans arisaemae]|uniref:HNH endonuclease signature motif containing protein n=1 Tax=Rhizohabitans arisaemae TaxID=2720610 RepID=UPI0024B1099C|nr:HNH endonuclease signature motif containing protein [Rhizohabitans arisaemae]
MTQRVPAGLAQMPPGAELARVLAGIDIGRVSAPDAVEVLKARYRQHCHDEAHLMAAMVEVGLRTPGPDSLVCRADAPDEFSSDELRPALVWSRRRAGSRFDEAWDLMSRLPMVHAALERGRIDAVKARAFAAWTRGLADEQARAVCGRLLPLAEAVTVAALVDAVGRAAVAIDPEWAERRFKAGVRERRVAGSRNPDGTANLSGLDQPLDRVAAACARVDALARRAKAAGDRRPSQHIRSELFLGLLDAGLQGLTDEEIVDRLVADSRAAGDLARSEVGRGSGVRRSGEACAAARPVDVGGSSGSRGVGGTVGASGLLRPVRSGGAGAAEAGDGVAPGSGSRAGGGWPSRGPLVSEAGRDGNAHTARSAVLGGSAGLGGSSGRSGIVAVAGGKAHPPAGGLPDAGFRGLADEGVVESPVADSGCGDGPARSEVGRDENAHVARSADLGGPSKQPGDAGAAEAHGLRMVEAGRAAVAAVADGVSSAGGNGVGGRSTRGPVTGGLEGTPPVSPRSWGTRDSDELEVGFPEPGRPDCEAPVASQRGWAAGELRVEVSTLLGLDDHPGELAGWGPVHAGLAREIAARQVRGQWRWTLTDDHGRLAACGVTRCRPGPRDDPGIKVPEPTVGPAGTGDRRGVVELRFTRSGLLRLGALPGLPGRWRRLLDDLTAQVVAGAARAGEPDRERPVQGGSGVGDLTRDGFDGTEVGADSHRTKAHGAVPHATDPGGTAPGRACPRRSSEGEGGSGSAGRDRAPDDRTERGGTEPGDTGQGPRFPGAALRRFVQVRDRTCTAPGCGVPASRTDQDHIREWRNDGRTRADNLHCVCRHDHRLRHEGGWQVAMSSAGVVVWTTRLGQIHPATPDQIIVPLPEPLPRRLTPLDYPIEDDDRPILADSSPAAVDLRIPGVSATTEPQSVPDSESDTPPF